MQERYIHLERINNGVLRVMAIGDQYQINDFLRLLRGHGYLICTDVSEQSMVIAFVGHGCSMMLWNHPNQRQSDETDIPAYLVHKVY
jgi:hypothetical protein